MIRARYELQRLRNRMRSRDEQQQRKALVGADGWLFLRNDKNNVLGQHLGQVRLGARRRRAWSRLLERRMALMRELGTTWLCVIAPDKEAVYPELLPPGMTPRARAARARDPRRGRAPWRPGLLSARPAAGSQAASGSPTTRPTPTGTSSAPTPPTS